jgi:glycosyltransferase involved in cell wall biosynthesis
MKSITVFTPTYNRAHLLPRLYESLCYQNCNDFIWLIIDDGSTDNTKNLVAGWIEEGIIDIQYEYKTNGGMHTGHNKAYSLIATELNVCIDSDDFLPSDAIDKIIMSWNSIVDKTKIAGVIGLDSDKNGNVIGSKIPEYLTQGSLHQLYYDHHVTGDKKIVLRTDIVQKYPSYPEFPEEKLVPLGILYSMIGNDYDYIYKNEVYCIVDYQEDGSSSSIFKQYKQSPKGFAYSRKIQIKYNKRLKRQLMNYAHLISSSFFAKDISIAFKGVNPLKSFLFFPFGILMHIYIVSKIQAK